MTFKVIRLRPFSVRFIRQPYAGIYVPYVI